VLQGLTTIVLGGLEGDRSTEDLVTGTVLTLVEGLRPRDQNPRKTPSSSTASANSA